jgi:hypothetical protein
MQIKTWSLKEFCRHARAYWPRACRQRKLPKEGHMLAARQWLDATVGIEAFLEKLKEASGDRASALAECAIWNIGSPRLVAELIKTAPGNRAMALWRCIDYRLLPEAAVESIKEAPGNRAIALYLCAYRGVMPWDEALELIKSAPGDRYSAMYWCARALLKNPGAAG